MMPTLDTSNYSPTNPSQHLYTFSISSSRSQTMKIVHTMLSALVALVVMHSKCPIPFECETTIARTSFPPAEVSALPKAASYPGDKRDDIHDGHDSDDHEVPAPAAPTGPAGKPTCDATLHDHDDSDSDDDDLVKRSIAGAYHLVHLPIIVG